MAHYQFVQNRECEFFPCHEGVPEGDFNCLFCYCPLYPLGEACGGNFCHTPYGVKDCSNCLIPHRRDNYDRILARMEGVLELAKKKEEAL